MMTARDLAGFARKSQGAKGGCQVCYIIAPPRSFLSEPIGPGSSAYVPSTTSWAFERYLRSTATLKFGRVVCRPPPPEQQRLRGVAESTLGVALVKPSHDHAVRTYRPHPLHRSEGADRPPGRVVVVKERFLEPYEEVPDGRTCGFSTTTRDVVSGFC